MNVVIWWHCFVCISFVVILVLFINIFLLVFFINRSWYLTLLLSTKITVIWWWPWNNYAQNKSKNTKKLTNHKVKNHINIKIQAQKSNHEFHEQKNWLVWLVTSKYDCTLRFPQYKEQISPNHKNDKHYVILTTFFSLIQNVWHY